VNLLLPLLLGQLVNPAALVGRHFYVASELDRVEQHFDPSQWVDGEPSRIDFGGPGHVHLGYAQDEDDCTFTATGGRARYELALTCGDPTHDRGRWIWTGEGRAKTDLVTTERGAGVMVDVVERAQPLDLAALSKEFDAAFAARTWPELVGIYRDAKGVRLMLAAEGQVRFAARRVPARLLRCDTETPEKPRPCLVLGKGDPGDAAFLFRKAAGGIAAEAGTIGSDVAYHPFEPSNPPRVFTRLP
jgi:hypothetical protein